MRLNDKETNNEKREKHKAYKLILIFLKRNVEPFIFTLKLSAPLS